MAVEFANDTTKRASALYSDYPENIIIMPELNGRHEHTEVDGLAADIAANGQLMPVLCRKNDQGLPVLIAGHRRYRSICLLNERNPEQRIKIKFEYAAVSEVEAFGMAIRENRQRKDVSPIDDCANIRTLQKRFNYTDEDVAKVYFPEAVTDAEKAEALRFVKQRAALVELAPEAAQAVRDGRVKITAAVGLARLTKDQQRAKVSQPGKVKVSDVKPNTASKPKAVTPAPVKPSENKAFTKAIYDLLSDVPVDDLDDKGMDLSMSSVPSCSSWHPLPSLPMNSRQRWPPWAL